MGLLHDAAPHGRILGSRDRMSFTGSASEPSADRPRTAVAA